jgi:hypothetical protein
MPDAPDADAEDVSYADRIAANADAIKEAWKATLADMKAMAEERREDGWSVTTCAALDTAPTNPDAGERDNFGLEFVLANNEAEAFEAAYEGKDFPQYEVYRASDTGRAYVLVEYVDPESETIIFIAGEYELRHAPGMVKAARREDEMYTFVRLIDHTVVGAFEHDSVEKFVPEIDRIEEYKAQARDPEAVAQKLDDVDPADVDGDLVDADDAGSDPDA